MVIRMRHTRAHTRNRRSHHALKETALVTCAHCGAVTRPHHMCLSCGYYKGRQVLDLATLKTARETRMREKRERIRADAGVDNAPTPTQPVEVIEEKKEKSEAPKKTRTRKVSEGSSSEKVKGDI